MSFEKILNANLIRYDTINLKYEAFDIPSLALGISKQKNIFIDSLNIRFKDGVKETYICPSFRFKSTIYKSCKKEKLRPGQS